MDLNSIGKFVKYSQAWEHKKTTHVEASEEALDDDEMDLSIRRFQYMASRKKRFSGRGSGFIGTSSNFNKDDQKGCFNCQKPDHLITYCPKLQKDKVKKGRFQKNNSRSKFKKSIMVTYDELDDDEEAGKNEEEANLDLMASTFSYTESEVDSDSYLKDEDEVDVMRKPNI
ncbi:hypothetical protein KIW84_070602 [Lathyrus oleraceus]|uniref:CCHC-type domain-containing protein n=1 Tax=Pisum sativum TaxID=3888 RepID=A0A9D4VHX3_PEA|nr:hypothetical protein KIW84_070602 [Pisum sativum]